MPPKARVHSAGCVSVEKRFKSRVVPDWIAILVKYCRIIRPVNKAASRELEILSILPVKNRVIERALKQLPGELGGLYSLPHTVFLTLGFQSL